MAGDELGGGLKVLKPGGVLVHNGAPESMSELVLLIALLLWRMMRPVRRKARGYGIHRVGFAGMKSNWLTLFEMLGKGKIRPVIAERMPLREARRAGELFEQRKLAGHIVLVAED